MKARERFLPGADTSSSGRFGHSPPGDRETALMVGSQARRSIATATRQIGAMVARPWAVRSRCGSADLPHDARRVHQHERRSLDSKRQRLERAGGAEIVHRCRTAQSRMQFGSVDLTERERAIGF